MHSTKLPDDMQDVRGGDHTYFAPSNPGFAKLFESSTKYGGQVSPNTS